jgi:hypothetical protein
MRRGVQGVRTSRLKYRGSAICRFVLVHDPEKWMPVFGKDHGPTQSPDHDPIRFDRIMV